MSNTITASARRSDAGRRPTRLLTAAAASVALGAALLTIDRFALHVVGYFLASFQTIGLLAAYTRIDAGRRAQPGYTPLRHGARLTSLLAVAGVAVAAAHVWLIATELAG